MKRTPIIVPAQVYLHNEMNEYAVVLKAVRGEVYFVGCGFYGKHELESFFERFSPVDPVDLTEQETAGLLALLPGPTEKLLIGWVEPDDDEEYDEFDEFEEAN